MDILIGTCNSYKLTEMMSLLEGVKGVKIHFMNEIEGTISVEEDQATLKANAEKKAREISKQTDCFVLTSDGGVNIPGLGNKWDVLKSQRTVGQNKPDREKVEVLMDLMSELKGQDRKCNYYLALALVKNGQLLWSFEDIFDSGFIVEKPAKGKIAPGLWMSHVWYYPQFNKTYVQLNETELTEVRKQGNKIKNELQGFLVHLL
ncbi:MAG: non-canonical purine NTP pyrophosphatase [Patescibacteria group bacterium]|jgi:inosine/xanthosine triphosphate pyrophosphatase family protein